MVEEQREGGNMALKFLVKSCVSSRNINIFSEWGYTGGFLCILCYCKFRKEEYDNKVKQINWDMLATFQTLPSEAISVTTVKG